MQLRVAVFSLVFFLSSFPPGSCEADKNTVPEEFSLKDAILIAFKNNKDLLMQEKEVLAARAGIQEAFSAFLPNVDLSASYTHREKVLYQSINAGFYNDNQVGLTANQTIYNGEANLANFKQSQLGLKVQEETLRAKKLDVEFEAKRLYYGLLLAYETERIAKEMVEQAQAHYLDVEHKFKEGTSSRFDVLQSKVQVSLSIPELIKARNAVGLIKADLNKLLGRKVDEPVKVKEKLSYTQIEIKEGEFLKLAYLGKPEMILKSLGIDINKWSIKMANAGYRPQIDIAAGLNYRSSNTRNIITPRNSNWNAGVSVTVPIFDGFSSKAKVDAAKARYAEAIIDKDNLSDQIAVDVRQACLNLRESQALIDSQKDDVGKAREALKIAEVSYDNGVGTNLDVIDSQVSLGQIQQNLAEGIYDYLMAEASLDRTMGKSYITEARHEKKS